MHRSKKQHRKHRKKHHKKKLVHQSNRGRGNVNVNVMLNIPGHKRIVSRKRANLREVNRWDLRRGLVGTAANKNVSYMNLPPAPSTVLQEKRDQQLLNFLRAAETQQVEQAAEQAAMQQRAQVRGGLGPVSTPNAAQAIQEMRNLHARYGSSPNPALRSLAEQLRQVVGPPTQGGAAIKDEGP